MTKEEIIEHLELEPHPNEVGYFRRTYESSLMINREGSERRLLTSIYYLLTSNAPLCYMHRNRSDIMDYHHLGAPIRYFIIAPNGKLREQVLGGDVVNGQFPQLLVKGGDWKVAQLCSGDYGLISEAVAPGFDYEDNEIATLEQLDSLFPHLVESLKAFIKPEAA